jgi:hypothetical protein
MEKQQRNKLWVGLGFILLVTGVSIWAYINLILPNRAYREKTGMKYTQKLHYKTQYNPDYIDSVIRAKEALKKQKKP